ncbi:protein YchT [Escherichia coli]
MLSKGVSSARLFNLIYG